MEKIKSFKQLKIWQKSIEIVKDVYTLTEKFPREEVYGLTSQIKSSSISIPSNIIAEGFKRFHDKEKKQFFNISLGSTSLLGNVLEKIDPLSKMLSSLLNKLNSKSNRTTIYEIRTTNYEQV